jgi:DNA-binding MarR family transcriptional regulator
MSHRPLTPRQVAVLEFLRTRSETGNSLARALARELNIATQSAQNHINRLAMRGAFGITSSPNRHLLRDLDDFLAKIPLWNAKELNERQELRRRIREALQ